MLADGTVFDGTLADGTEFEGTLAEGMLADGAVFTAVVFTGVVFTGVVFDGALLDGTVFDGVLVGVAVTGVVAATEAHSGSAACSASSQLPRTSPGTPLSSGVPASRDAASAGTARVSVAQPAMIQMRCRFMGGLLVVGVVTMKPVPAGTSPVDDGATTSATPFGRDARRSHARHCRR
jgi:hypothetical protein